MIRKLLALAVFAALAMTAGPAPAKPAPPPSPAAQQARVFVEGVYGRLAHDELFCATCGEHRREVFDAATVAILEEDDRLTPEGELGAIDADPLCQCQDNGGMTAAVTGVRLTGKASATVSVRLTFHDGSPPRVDDIALLVVRTPAGWRIHDILAADGSSFRQMVVESNADARKAQAGGGG